MTLGQLIEIERSLTVWLYVSNAFITQIVVFYNAKKKQSISRTDKKTTKQCKLKVTVKFFFI